MRPAHKLAGARILAIGKRKWQKHCTFATMNDFYWNADWTIVYVQAHERSLRRC